MHTESCQQVQLQQVRRSTLPFGSMAGMLCCRLAEAMSQALLLMLTWFCLYRADERHMHEPTYVHLQVTGRRGRPHLSPPAQPAAEPHKKLSPSQQARRHSQTRHVRTTLPGTHGQEQQPCWRRSCIAPQRVPEAADVHACHRVAGPL